MLALVPRLKVVVVGHGSQGETTGSLRASRAKKASVSNPVPVKSPAAVMHGMAALSGSTFHHQSQETSVRDRYSRTATCSGTEGFALLPVQIPQVMPLASGVYPTLLKQRGKASSLSYRLPF